jgi:hypothetical protein
MAEVSDEAAVAAIGRCPACRPRAVPAAMPPSKMMVPSWLSTVRASITPVLFTTLASKASGARAQSTLPPSV